MILFLPFLPWLVFRCMLNVLEVHIFNLQNLLFQKKAKTAALSNANKMRDELLAMDDDNVDDQVII